MSINNREKKRIRTETEFSRNYFLSSKKEKEEKTKINNGKL